MEKERRELLEKKQKGEDFQPKLPAYWVKVSGAYCPILQLNKSEGGKVRVNIMLIIHEVQEKSITVDPSKTYRKPIPASDEKCDKLSWEIEERPTVKGQFISQPIAKKKPVEEELKVDLMNKLQSEVYVEIKVKKGTNDAATLEKKKSEKELRTEAFKAKQREKAKADREAKQAAQLAKQEESQVKQTEKSSDKQEQPKVEEPKDVEMGEVTTTTTESPEVKPTDAQPQVVLLISVF